MGQLTTATADETSRTEQTTIIRPPTVHDGGAIWKVARDSGSLDLNTSYAYLLLARDMAETSRVAVRGEEIIGFVLGYRRPAAPETHFVWQIAVDESARGERIAGRLLDSVLSDLHDIRTLETTITEDNTASQRLFDSLARRHDAEHTVTELFTADMFPDGHDGELLHVIGDLRPTT